MSKNHQKSISIIMLYGVSLCFLFVVALIPLFSPEITHKILVRDPIATFNGHQLTGVVSNIGILAWTIAVTVCFFSCAICLQSNYSTVLVRFFGMSGIFTLVLLLDDLFMLHEDHSDFNIPDEILFTSYLIFLLLYIQGFRKLLFQKTSILFLLSLFCFSVSLFMDLVLSESSIVSRSEFVKYFLEDAFKFLGIMSWTGFLVDISFRKLMALFHHKSPREFPREL
ncbi:MAG: hypothetical protein AAGF01_14075 [Cyanobacteria bacterium P01_G01_bin.38]